MEEYFKFQGNSTNDSELFLSEGDLLNSINSFTKDNQMEFETS